MENGVLGNTQITPLNEQWRYLQEHFAEFEASMAERIEEMELKERGLDERIREVKLKEEGLRRENELVSKLSEELEMKERKFIEECRLFDETKRVIEMVEVSEEGLRGFREKLELREKEVNEGFEELVLKERDLERQCKALELRERSVNEGFEELELREKDWERQCKGLELREGNVSEGFEELESRELESREKGFERQCNGVELREGNVIEGFEELETREKGFERQCNGVESREGNVIEGFEELGLREKGLEKKCVKEMEEELNELKLERGRIEKEWEEMALERKSISDCFVEIEFKIKQICQGVKGLKLVEKDLDESCEAIESEKEELREGKRDLESRERQMLEDHMWVEHEKKVIESKKEELREGERDLESRERQMLEDRMWVEHEKKLMAEPYEALELRVKQLEESCVEIVRKNREAMELREQQLNEGLGVLGMKARRVEELGREMDLREQQLNERCQAQESKEKQMNEKGRALESKEKRIKRLRYQFYHHETKIQINRLCKAMDGKGLQMFLNDRVREHDHELLRGVLGKALKMLSGAPKLVLAAVYKFFPPYIKRPEPDSRAYETGTVRSSCVLVLELLMKTSHCITADVRDVAVDLAKQWKKKLMAEGETDVVVLGFLLFVAVYDLGSDFDRSDLQRLFDIVAQHRLAPELCSRLGFSESKNGTSSPQQESGKPESDSSRLANAVVVSPVPQGQEQQPKNGKPKSDNPRVTSTDVPSTVEGTENPAELLTVKTREVSNSPPDLVSDALVSSKVGKKRSRSSIASPNQAKDARLDAKPLSVTAPRHSTGSKLRPAAPAGPVMHPLTPHQPDTSRLPNSVAVSSLLPQGREPESKIGKPKSDISRVTSTDVFSTVEGTKNPAKLSTLKIREASVSPPTPDAQVKHPRLDSKQLTARHSAGSMLRPATQSVLRPHQSYGKTLTATCTSPPNQVNQPTAGSNQTPTPHRFCGPMLRPPTHTRSITHPARPYVSPSNRTKKSSAAISTPNQMRPRLGGFNPNLPVPHHYVAAMLSTTPATHTGSSIYPVRLH